MRVFNGAGDAARMFLRAEQSGLIKIRTPHGRHVQAERSEHWDN